jgi:dipeptidyl aminopeptidase/acylaminoacyl peptidase
MKRKLGNNDLFSIHWVSDPQIAPDGAYIAYVESWLDRAVDSEVSDVRVVDRSGAHVLPHLAEPGMKAQAPRWSPDSAHLGLITALDGIAQLWVVELATGAKSGVAGLPGVPLDFAWSPDGGHLVVAVEGALVDARCYTDGQPDEVNGAPDAAEKRYGLYRVDWRDGRSEPLVLNDHPLWHPRWSPSRPTIAFLQAGKSGETADLWLLDLTGTLSPANSPVKLTDGAGPVVAFTWSPDGDQLAYVAHRHGEAADVNYHLWRASLADRATVDLTNDLDLSVGVPVRADDPRGRSAVLAWSKVSNRIYFEVAEGGRGPIRWVGADGRSGSLLDGTFSDGTLLDRRSVALSPSCAVEISLIALVVTTPESPGDIFVLDEFDVEPHRVSASNPWLAEVELPRTDAVHAHSTDGVEVEGWLVRQESAVTTGAALPLVVSVHGGPHYAVGWRFYFEHLRLAAQGYVVLAANPRGSLGYGERFSAGIRGDWGGQDWLDTSTLIALARQEPFVDPDRVAITGVSYGGFMAQWAISRTNGFRAAISENGISNFLAVWGTAEGAAAAIENAFGGPPWRRAANYVSRSPLCSVDTVSTPLLLIHAEEDRNCPIEQSEQMYRALKEMGQEVELLRLPGEGHLVNLIGRPSSRVARAEAVDAWLVRHLVRAPAEPCDDTVPEQG